MAVAVNTIDQLLQIFQPGESTSITQRAQTGVFIDNDKFPHHCSWDDAAVKYSAQSIVAELRALQSGSAQVPIYDVGDSHFNISNKAVQRQIYDTFFNQTGAIIVRGAYSNKVMEQYNAWCESFLEVAKLDGNCRHPKQPGKYLINDVVSRLGAENADLLLRLINNPFLTMFCDILLGFMKYGSVTTHWIESGGDRQLSHVDYPLHVGSGPFWEHNVHKMMHLSTAHQVSQMLPFYSIQVLIASDKMNTNNGSTELIPCSHRLSNIDALIHDKAVYQALEPHFINVDLQQGDFLIFNRRLVHRGGKNVSDKRRNSLIMQCVWLWAVGQEIMDKDAVQTHLKQCSEFQKLSTEQQQQFLTRMIPPYPADIKKQT